MSGELWSMMTIIGPILFGVVLLWVLLNNRRSPEEKARTETATHQRQAEEEAENKAHSPD
jgi:hypothetical protein